MGSTSRTGMTKLFGKTGALFVLSALLGTGCCANRPWIQAVPPEPMAAAAAHVVETAADAPTIIIVQPADPAAQADVVVQQSAPVSAPPSDGWVPDALPATNPFEKFRTWVGDYDCTQGNTGFALRIVDVRGRAVRAIFDFFHSPSGANGSYIVTGKFDPETRRVHFDPSSWIVQPADYLMVPMTGEIAADNSLFAGKIDYAGCGAFKLKPTR
jgi:hypothetical protein